MASIELKLDLIRLSPDLAQALDVQCSTCHDSLVIHQPDETRPDRFLGTCLECGDWFLIDAAKHVMVRLPDQDALRET